MSGRIIIAAWNLECVAFASLEGEVIAEYDWPPEGATYVGMGKARTCFSSEEKTGRTVTDVLIQNRHRCPETSHRVLTGLRANGTAR